MKKTPWVKKVLEKAEGPQLLRPPSISLIIPTFNCAERIELTLQSIARQQYPQLEVIVVDAGSTDHTLSILRSYDHLVDRIYTVADFHLVKMLNRGISLASSGYITFVYPGSYYLSSHTLMSYATAAIQHTQPELVYCGFIQRELMKDPHLINKSLEEYLLKHGKFPMSLSAILVRADVFDLIGKFDETLKLRFGFEWVCRLSQQANTSVKYIQKVLVDVDLGTFTYGKAFIFTWETWKILGMYFGLWATLTWAWHLNHRDLIKIFCEHLRQRFVRS